MKNVKEKLRILLFLSIPLLKVQIGTDIGEGWATSIVWIVSMLCHLHKPFFFPFPSSSRMPSVCMLQLIVQGHLVGATVLWLILVNFQHTWTLGGVILRVEGVLQNRQLMSVLRGIVGHLKCRWPFVWSLSIICLVLCWFWLFMTQRTLTWQDPLSMGFSRQEHWSGLPFPSPEDLLNPEIEPRFPTLQAESLPTKLWGKRYKIWWTKSVLQLIILYHLWISCFFFNSKVFLYVLKIGLEVWSLIQVFFF